MNVELIYDGDCPNVAGTRSMLIEAFTTTGVSARWKEWERSSADAPDYARCYGSPTILIDGKDVAGAAPSPGTHACRVYSDGGGKLSRIPPLEVIRSALLGAAPGGKPTTSRWQAAIASFPAIGTVLLPKLACPLCFPAYAAILSALGLEFVDYTPYLLPLSIAFLVIVVGVLAAQTRRSGNAAPLILGIAASLVILAGRFGMEIGWLTTSGVVLLIAAVLFGSRRKSTEVAPCPACAADGSRQRAEAH